ncbi:C-type lectin domain family 4 member K-like isoform X2 [Hemicordylus capensis]|uniref:C-type lectin domain family 4 member K-like isoform X2 n=1 Tax=Hemicordylus capensis TaxID=884348 RepID=UPI002302264B|nr:C-type lectin domain family 4 member K-like isoform X2 [Hemicordylus capensis]XP_053113671.1 C-type lectin domain family 4 member K-like isoform X2 [Hemicordylus capensis]
MGLLDDTAKKLEHDIDLAKGLGKLVCLLLFFAAAVMAFLCYLEYEKKRGISIGLKRIRKHMIIFNPALEGKSDVEILTAADELALSVTNLEERIEKVHASFDDIVQKIQDGWKIFNKTLFYFTKEVTFSEYKAECQGKKLQYIEFRQNSQELQDFVQKQAARLGKGIWVPAEKQKTDDPFLWSDNGGNTSGHYWMPGNPSNGAHEYCIQIPDDCKTSPKCWDDIQCASKKIGMCQMSPDKRWMES